MQISCEVFTELMATGVIFCCGSVSTRADTCASIPYGRTHPAGLAAGCLGHFTTNPKDASQSHDWRGSPMSLTPAMRTNVSIEGLPPGIAFSRLRTLRREFAPCFASRSDRVSSNRRVGTFFAIRKTTKCLLFSVTQCDCPSGSTD